MKHLSRHQQEILKSLYPNNVLNDNEFKKNFDVSWDDKSCSELFNNQYITHDTSRLHMPGLISLTEGGRAYIEDLNTKEFDRNFHITHVRVNTAIAIAAIIISIISLLISTIAILKQ